MSNILIDLMEGAPETDTAITDTVLQQIRTEAEYVMEYGIMADNSSEADVCAERLAYWCLQLLRELAETKQLTQDELRKLNAFLRSEAAA